MSQPAIFPYLTGLEDYYQMDYTEALDKFYQDNKDRIENIYPTALPFGYGEAHFNKNYNNPLFYVEERFGRFNLTDSQKESLTKLVDIQHDTKKTHKVRMSAAFMLAEFIVSQEKLLR